MRKDKQKRRIGPRPELVQEVQDRIGQPFHLVTVQTFLIHAKDYLEAEVSDSTVEQAERIEHPTFPMPANQGDLPIDAARWLTRARKSKEEELANMRNFLLHNSSVHDSRYSDGLLEFLLTVIASGSKPSDLRKSGITEEGPDTTDDESPASDD